MNEFEWIEWIKKRAGKNPAGWIGIGDDAAVLDIPKMKKMVTAADVIVEGVDFIKAKAKPELVGRKVLAINLSDLAAMGAAPSAFLISIGRPPSYSDAWLKQFFKGLLKIAKQYKVYLVGGDFSRSKTFFASVTILGTVDPKKAVLRSGAKAGDWIAVTGSLGGSIQGKHFTFEPRIREGRFLANRGFASSMIDVSDGLAQDLGHLLAKIRRPAEIDLAAIPKGSRTLSVKRALTDGEDFELLFTVRPARKNELEKSWKRKFPKTRLSWIGRIVKGEARITWMNQGRKVNLEFKRMGFKHF